MNVVSRLLSAAVTALLAGSIVVDVRGQPAGSITAITARDTVFVAPPSGCGAH
jgi:hypothetical protein